MPGPPPGWPRPPKISFWSTTKGSFTIIGIIFGSLALITVAFAGIAYLSNQGSSSMDAKILSCSFAGDTLPTATVEYTIKNNGNSTRGATIHIEYRDSSGNRVDTDTARVRSIQPGDTVRSEEVTFLDASVSSGTCVITGID
jgi:hypothetical protein